MTYRKEHKIILQTVMNEGAVHADRIKELIIRLFDHDDTMKILNEINAKLRPLYMIIKRINCEVTGELYWVFAYTVQDKTNYSCLEFSKVELVFLRSVYSEIITSNNGYVSSTFCLNLCSSLHRKLSKSDAEQFLNKIVNKKWLVCKDGKYYMGVRSIGELTQYFKDTYNDNFQICNLCKQELFYSEKCDNCDATMHIYCLKNYAQNHGDLECPNCRHHMSKRHKSSDNNATSMDINYVS